ESAPHRTITTAVTSRVCDALLTVNSPGLKHIVRPPYLGRLIRTALYEPLHLSRLIQAALSQTLCLRRPSSNYSPFAPDAFTTLPHFTDSLRMNAANSAGVLVVGSKSAATIFSRCAGSATMRTISLFSRCTISPGVRAGATTPYHTLAS